MYKENEKSYLLINMKFEGLLKVAERFFETFVKTFSKQK